jgi:hypothetical protein
MPLLARRAASATERTLVYFRMTMYMNHHAFQFQPCTHQIGPRRPSGRLFRFYTCEMLPNLILIPG